MPNTESGFLAEIWHSAQKVFQKKFLYDILKTFIGVLLAVWVNEWKSDKASNYSESIALGEIRQELELDISDMEDNLRGHKNGIEAARYFLRALRGQPIGEDSLMLRYNELLRNFVSIQHSTAYETLKSRGLELIGDDSLRMDVINLFDFHFETIEKLEEQYAPHDFFNFYYHGFNEKLAPYINIGPKGVWQLSKPLSQMPEQDKKLVTMWLQRIAFDRKFLITVYQEVQEKSVKVSQDIDAYLAK